MTDRRPAFEQALALVPGRTALLVVDMQLRGMNGADVIIASSVSDDEAREIYPEGWKSPRPYIRIVPAPETNVVGSSS